VSERRKGDTANGREAAAHDIGGALHSAYSDLSGVGADTLFAGVASDKTRRPGPPHVQHAGVGNVSNLGRSPGILTNDDQR
jgi:hypothetical protein